MPSPMHHIMELCLLCSHACITLSIECLYTKNSACLFRLDNACKPYSLLAVPVCLLLVRLSVCSLFRLPVALAVLAMRCTTRLLLITDNIVVVYFSLSITLKHTLHGKREHGQDPARHGPHGNSSGDIVPQGKNDEVVGNNQLRVRGQCKANNSLKGAPTLSFDVPNDQVPCHESRPNTPPIHATRDRSSDTALGTTIMLTS